MERIILLDEIKNYEEIKDFDHVYLGNEFCQNLIPPLSKFKLQIKKLKDKDFSFVSPFVTDKGMGKLEKIFKYLNVTYNKPEVIVNDLGVLYFLHKNYPKIKKVFGRLLYPNVFLKPKDEIIKIKSKSIIDLFMKYKIDRYELSVKNADLTLKTLEKQVNSEELFKNLQFSFYYPYFPISVTRKCKMRIQKEFNDYGPCQYKCKGNLFEIRYPNQLCRHALVDDILYMKGNTYFIKGKKLTNTSKLISRLVFQVL